MYLNTQKVIYLFYGKATQHNQKYIDTHLNKVAHLIILPTCDHCWWVGNHEVCSTLNECTNDSALNNTLHRCSLNVTSIITATTSPSANIQSGSTALVASQTMLFIKPCSTWWQLWHRRYSSHQPMGWSVV